MINKVDNVSFTGIIRPNDMSRKAAEFAKKWKAEKVTFTKKEWAAMISGGSAMGTSTVSAWYYPILRLFSIITHSL